MKKKTTETGKDKVRETLEQLEQGVADVFSSERYERYLKFIASFYEYSLNNVLLIAMQRPTATLVAGFNAWKKRGRVVKAGEKGIRILAPIPRRSVSTATNDDETVFVVKNWITYRVAYVFDVAQTEGDDLPTLATKLEGDVEFFKTANPTAENIAKFLCDAVSQDLKSSGNDAICFRVVVQESPGSYAIYVSERGSVEEEGIGN